ncbi:MAG: phosphopantothenoylcysteine decarboxylase [Verrucomicrobiales bacterium]|nr:phosphopantothenoylcysteine decarboxylase [Verrucomicrobiales bacterium]
MRILITAGPTREPIDPVRYLTNHSSGKMGYATAESAINRGHQVILISGPVNLKAPKNCELIQVQTAAEMYMQVELNSKDCDAAIMVAAVADYTPAEYSEKKIKKTKNKELTLVRTKDILGSMRGGFKFNGILVGFAADTDELRESATRKMKEKGCNFIVANDISRADIGFGSDQNEVIIFDTEGRQDLVKKSSKQLIGEVIIEKIEKINNKK